MRKNDDLAEENRRLKEKVRKLEKKLSRFNCTECNRFFYPPKDMWMCKRCRNSWIRRELNKND